jgi:hypothetical protein
MKCRLMHHTSLLVHEERKPKVFPVQNPSPPTDDSGLHSFILPVSPPEFGRPFGYPPGNIGLKGQPATPWTPVPNLSIPEESSRHRQLEGCCRLQRVYCSVYISP